MQQAYDTALGMRFVAAMRTLCRRGMAVQGGVGHHTGAERCALAVPCTKRAVEAALRQNNLRYVPASLGKETSFSRLMCSRLSSLLSTTTQWRRIAPHGYACKHTWRLAAGHGGSRVQRTSHRTPPLHRWPSSAPPSQPATELSPSPSPRRPFLAAAFPTPGQTPGRGGCARHTEPGRVSIVLRVGSLSTNVHNRCSVLQHSQRS